MYSVPPLRLKQYAVPAFMIIATVRGFLLNFGVYSATRAALGLPFEWSPAVRWGVACARVCVCVCVCVCVWRGWEWEEGEEQEEEGGWVGGEDV
mgnify:CR=1 FL=1